MGVSFGRTRVADLAFQVYGRGLHPEWFSVRSFLRVAKAGWEADVRIIEGGHAVVWRSGGTRLTEVLAGPETALPESCLMYHSAVRHERSATLRLADGIVYRACFEVERNDPEVFSHLSDELALDALKGGLFHSYSPSNRLARSPLSLLRVEPRAQGLLILAFHTFPEERAILRTQTLFETRDSSPA